MALSELHSRLEHLVTYSSQLIFVSGETIGDQQRSLQTFLGQQNENAEIAFINGEPDIPIQSYRKQISRQLLGDESGLFTRPLNELLAPLNHHDGPVLICICQAEHLPQPFLQELWDLVLQSRFASNKQHLNVLLFGQSTWAEEAKTWLPAKNRDKPLLLSTESVRGNEPNPSELDALIAEKRRQFEQRMRNRALGYQSAPSKLHSWWFKLVIGVAFLATFSGIMMWQYSDSVPLPWNKLQHDETDKDSIVIQPPTVTENDAAEREAPEPAPLKMEIVSRPPSLGSGQPSEQQASVTPPSEDPPALLEQPQDRVTDWQTAVENITPPTVSAETENKAEQLERVETVSLGQSPAELSEAGAVEDYAVEDIVSVSQLPVSELQNETSTTPEPVPNTDASENTEILTIASEVPEATFDSEALMALDPAQYVIQIAGMSDRRVMQEFISDHQLAPQILRYTTQRYGGDWYVLLSKDSFTTIDQARAAMQSLPAAMQRGTPFVKSVRRVQGEIQNAK